MPLKQGANSCISSSSFPSFSGHVFWWFISHTLKRKQKKWSSNYRGNSEVSDIVLVKNSNKTTTYFFLLLIPARVRRNTRTEQREKTGPVLSYSGSSSADRSVNNPETKFRMGFTNSPPRPPPTFVHSSPSLVDISGPRLPCSVTVAACHLSVPLLHSNAFPLALLTEALPCAGRCEDSGK